MATALDLLLQHQSLWRGRERGRTRQAAESSGHAVLDEILPGGGWPLGALSEILLPHPGFGELSLLLPVLARLTQAGRPVVFVNPPHSPQVPALVQGGVVPERVLLVRGNQGRDAHWAVEQALRSARRATVLSWTAPATATPSASVDERTLRRWQLAAEEGQALAFVFRPLSVERETSPAALRLRLGTAARRPEGQAEGGRSRLLHSPPARIRLALLKARGLPCSSATPLELELP